jgi:poly(A) polymerase/tRNA nucleotidyltransferase (CCA-adding enzyme)
MEIPKEIKLIIEKLEKAGFEAYIVGGCVRDFLRKVKPNDWDISTSAKPEEVAKIFPRNFQDNNFGLVTVLTGSLDKTLGEIQIMPYRTESKYTDKRHPDKVFWVKTIEEDLSRRDFTVNAIAFSPKSGLVDLFKGQQDLKKKVIRAVGDPNDRFSEDALRMIRAVRFSVTLGKAWKIEAKTKKAIEKNATLLGIISKERIRDEFLKIIMSEEPAEGIELLRTLNLLKYVIPELEEGYKISQNKHHLYDCYEHNLRSLTYGAKKGYNQYVRLAALLHDIAKPRTKQGEGQNATFYGHEIVGAKMTVRILDSLRFSKKDVEKIAKLVRYHLFYYNAGEVTESSVRRLVRNAGPENLEELLQVRHCDRIGSGCPKAEPYKLRHLRYIIERVSQDPISVRKLEIDGNELMEILKIKPGPQIGQVLDILLGEVLDEPTNNTGEYLAKRVAELGKLKEEELLKLAEKAEKEREKIETKRDEMTKQKYWVT